MKSKSLPLSIEERVRLELEAYRQEAPAAKISVAEVCRRSGVSRATLYEFHRSLVEEIRGSRCSCADSTKGVPADPLAPDVIIERLKKKNQALLYICIELQNELKLLRAQLDARRSTTKRGSDRR
jgi:hypothetical protein